MAGGVGKRKPRDLSSEWTWSLVRIAIGVLAMNVYNFFKHEALSTRAVDATAGLSTLLSG